MISPSGLFALCILHEKDVIGSTFQYTYNCDNTQRAVRYQIIRKFTDRIDFEFFTFDPFGWNLMCTKLSVDDVVIDNECSQTGFNRSLSYENTDVKIDLILSVALDEVASKFDRREQYLFNYPSDAEFYQEVGCAIFVKETMINLYSIKPGIETLGDCLLNYEYFLTRGG